MSHDGLTRFKDKVAVVTGGASGIGLQIARQLLAEGAAVVAGDLNRDALRHLSDELGDRFVGIETDVCDEQSIEALIDEATERFGMLNVAINAAGLGAGEPVIDLSIEQWRRVLDICLTGAFLSTKHEARRMVSGAGGAIVNITSINASIPAYGAAAYCVAKAGLAMLTKVAALELGEKGVRVTAIAPGLVDTPMAARTGHTHPLVREEWLRRTPIGRIGRPDDIAAAALFLASDEASWVTGTTVYVDGGLTLTGGPDLRAAFAAVDAQKEPAE